MIDAFKRASAGRITAVDPVLRLRPLGQEGPAARPDHGPPDRRHDHGGRRGPGPHDGPPPGPDPGLLQHPGRRADRRPPALQLLPPEGPDGPRGRHRPRASRSAPGPSPSCSTRRSRSSRSAAWATSTGPRCSTSSARSGAGARSSSTTRSTPPGRCMEIVRALRARGRRGDLRLRHPRHPVRAGRSTGSRRSGIREVVLTDSVPLPPREAASRRSRRSPWRPLIGEAIRRIHRGESVGALFCSEVVAHPGDDPLGGRRRADARRPHRRHSTPPEHLDDGATTRDHPAEIAGPAPARSVRRPMTLQLHRPDGQGGLEPPTETPKDWRDPAPLAALARAARWRTRR